MDRGREQAGSSSSDRRHRWRRATRLAVVAATAAVLPIAGAGTRAGAASASPVDTVGPAVSSVTLGTSSVDASSGPVVVPVQLTATDDLSGVAAAVVELTGPDTDAPGNVTSGGGPTTLVSGTSQDGVFTIDVPLPRWARTGTWCVTYVDARDGLDNRTAYQGSHLTAPLGPCLTVTSAGDTGGPTVGPITITPSTIDTSTGPQAVHLDIPVTDDLSGTDSIGLNALSPTFHGAQQYAPGNATAPASGTRLDGTWHIDLTIPPGALPGQWCLNLGATDYAGYTTVLAPTDPDPTCFTVSATHTAPEVTSSPADTTVTYGDPATFDVGVTGGAPAPTVHWERSTDGGATYQLVPDATGLHEYATGSHLRVEGPTVAETGDLYRAVVDNGVNDPVRSAPATLTVLRRPLQVTPDDVTVGYGTPPELTYTITGWVENPEQLDADPVCGVADEHTAQGTYEITCSGGASPNYAFDYGTATLTVTPAHLTVTAKDQSTVYGSADPAFTFVVTGFLPGDEAALTTPPTCGVAGPHTTVGTYAIHCGGAAAPGYEVTYVDGDLEVTSATLTVVADDATRPFGAANPPLTAHLVGFVNGDGPSTVHGTASCTSPAGPSTPIGTSAPITCTAGTLSAHDYSFAIGAPGHLTITAAPTVLVEHPTKVGLLGLTRTVSATLTRASDGAPLAGRRVSFVVGGAVLCTATTDAHGTASCSLFGLFLSLGRLSVTSTWAGDGSYVGTSSAPTSF